MRTWQDRAEQLRAEGLSIRQIAAQVGRSRSTVGEHFKPHFCACGNRRAHHHKQCVECYTAARAAARDEAHATLVRMWRAGANRVEIAAVIGYTPASVSARVAELRALGVDLPHRRPEHMVEIGRALGQSNRTVAA